MVMGLLLLISSHYFYGYGTLIFTNDTETNSTYYVPLYPKYKHFVLYGSICVYSTSSQFSFYLLVIVPLFAKLFLVGEKPKESLYPQYALANNSKQQRQISQLTVTLILLGTAFFFSHQLWLIQLVNRTGRKTPLTSVLLSYFGGKRNVSQSPVSTVCCIIFRDKVS